MAEEQPQAVLPGSVVLGIENAAGLATQQLSSLWWIRRCSIAIANGSTFALTSPRIHESAGKIVSLALEIPPSHTGLIGANKTMAWASGTSGLITYKIEEETRFPRYLQILWSVPYAGHNWVNVTIGDEPASNQLFSRLYNGTSGRICKAQDTSISDEFPLNSLTSVKIDTFMSTSSHAVLVVQLRNIKSK